MSDHELPIAGDSGRPAVPVFDCRVILSRDAESDRLHGRVANLAGITASSTSERELLMQIVKLFKATVQKHVASGEPIPWKQPEDQAEPGESERWVPVHL